MTYTKEFKEEVKTWYFENGESLTKTARHFSIPVQYVYRWKDINKQRERDRKYEKSASRKAYLEKHKAERNEYLRKYRKTEAGKEAEKRSAKKKKQKTISKHSQLKDCIIPYIDCQIDETSFKYDCIVWKIGLHGYIRGGHQYYYHRYIYEKIVLKGEHIPYGWQVHHIDQDKLNNSLSNLVCVPEEVHNYLHYLLRNNKQEEYSRLIKEYKLD